MDGNIAPGFLVAMPRLVDPNFNRTVILMCAHSEEGAFGLVMNRPMDITVPQICREAGISWSGPDVPMIHRGGPVEPQRGWIIHDTLEMYEGSELINDQMAFTPSQEGLVAYGRKPAGRFRLVLGYAGWGPAQLDREMAEGSWLSTPIDPQVVFDLQPEQMWEAALRVVGVDPMHLVDGGPMVH